jgi:hypothetical protein
MGHASMRAALIYQHATSERDREIAAGIDKRIAAAQAKTAKPAKRKRRKKGDDARPAAWPGLANGTWKARKIQDLGSERGPASAIMSISWAFVLGAADGNRTRTVSLED